VRIIGLLVVAALVAAVVGYVAGRAAVDDTGSGAPGSPTAGTTVAPGGQGSGGAGSGARFSGSGLDIPALLATVAPSVVAVEVGVASNGRVRQVGAGSGVVISSDGLVLTNAHVVQPTDQLGRSITNVVLNVQLADGDERSATLLGAAPGNDIALLRVDDTSGLVPIAMGSSTDLRVGDDVVAIGNALGLGNSPTVTRGIVSAKDRTLQVDGTLTLSDLIQTDAAINPGNSGGALVNASGELIGINSAGIPRAQNVGFAIAIDSVKPLIDDLRAGRTATTTPPTAVLGVTLVASAAGVVVAGVATGSGAAAAGIQDGDVVLRIGSTTITAPDDVRRALTDRAPGDVVEVEIDRSGTRRTVTARLGSR
jgi:serine protease Do